MSWMFCFTLTTSFATFLFKLTNNSINSTPCLYSVPVRISKFRGTTCYVVTNPLCRLQFTLSYVTLLFTLHPQLVTDHELVLNEVEFLTNRFVAFLFTDNQNYPQNHIFSSLLDASCISLEAYY
jgi:hypothetical protein